MILLYILAIVALLPVIMLAVYTAGMLLWALVTFFRDNWVLFIGAAMMLGLSVVLTHFVM